MPPLSAQATLASDYVDLRGSDSQIALLRQTVAAYQRSLQITENQLMRPESPHLPM